MRSTFSDYCATQDARNTIQLNIRKYCLMLCDALLMDFNRRGHTLEYKFYVETARITKFGWKLRLDLVLFTPLLIRKRVKSTNPLASMHLQRLFAIIFSRINSREECFRSRRLGRFLSLHSLIIMTFSNAN